MTSWRAAAFMGLCLLAVTGGPARAQSDTDLSRATLRGVAGVAVVIENLKQDAQLDGLHQADIQADVELELRRAGIRVLTDTESAYAAAQPWLYVDVNTVKRDGEYLFAVGVHLNQSVTLASGERAFAATWQISFVGSVGAANLPQVRGEVTGTVRKFVGAWLAANPKRL
jgi:hypothetical protein